MHVQSTGDKAMAGEERGVEGRHGLVGSVSLVIAPVGQGAGGVVGTNRAHFTDTGG